MVRRQQGHSLDNWRCSYDTGPAGKVFVAEVFQLTAKSGTKWALGAVDQKLEDLPDPTTLPKSLNRKDRNWWPGADKIAGSDFGRTKCARRVQARDGLHLSTTDTRIFSPLQEFA
jgi:hypothetical protein